VIITVQFRSIMLQAGHSVADVISFRHCHMENEEIVTNYMTNRIVCKKSINKMK